MIWGEIPGDKAWSEAGSGCNWLGSGESGPSEACSSNAVPREEEAMGLPRLVSKSDPATEEPSVMASGLPAQAYSGGETGS